MEFKARVPREGINLSKVHPLREATLLVLGLSLLLFLLLFIITRGIDWAVRWISPETEERVFGSLSANLADWGFNSEGDERQEKGQALLERLAAHWPDQPYTLRLRVIRDPAPNAMALPGGLILVTDGLLDRVASENELALVLGHELGHFYHRDHLRRLGRSMVYGLVVAALTGGNPSLDPATFAGNLANRGFDREHELQADHFGLSLLQAEYGHVAGSWSFFASLLAEESDKVLGIYLSTHPANAARIAGLKTFAEAKGWPLDGELKSF